MKTKTAKVLPKTAHEIANGGLYLQRVRCGKSNCKCARGENHSAYYFFTRRRGKLFKLYVLKADIEEFSRLARQATNERKHRRQTTKTNLDLLKKMRQQLRDKTALINSLKGK